MPFGPDLVIYSQISLIRTTLFRHNVGLARYPDNRNRKNKERNSFQSKCWQCKQRWRCSVQWTRLNGRSKGSREKYRLRRTANLSKYIDCMWNMSKWNTHFLFCFCLSADLIDRHKMVCIQNEKKAKQIFYKRPNCVLQVLPLLHALCVEDWLSHFHCDLINNKVTVGVIRFSVFFSIDLKYPFLNCRVGVGQRGFRVKGLKCIGRNPFLAVLCRVAEIPVNRRSDKRGFDCILNANQCPPHSSIKTVKPSPPLFQWQARTELSKQVSDASVSWVPDPLIDIRSSMNSTEPNSCDE